MAVIDMTQDSHLTHAIWNGWLSQDVRAIIRPTSEAEVVEAVQAARARGGKVKAIGGRHSFNNISFSRESKAGRGDTIVDVGGLRQVKSIDHASGKVCVQAGIALHELVAILAYHGLALPNIGAWMEQTLAGVLATGTHGSGGRYRGSLLSAFETVRIVDGTGTSRALSDHERGFLNLGCFGVVTEVTLACVPLFYCERQKLLVEVDAAIDNILMHLHQNDFVDLRWTGRLRTGTLTTWNRTERRPSLLDRFRTWLEGYLLGAVHVGLANYPYDWMPQWLSNQVFAGVGAAYTHLAFQDSQVDIWYRALTYNSRAPIAPHDEFEFAVPIAQAAACVHDVRRILAKHPQSAGLEIQLRFTGPSRLGLAPNFDRETMWFNFNQFDRAGTQSLMPELTAVVLAHGGRPHWSKNVPDDFCPRAGYGHMIDEWEAVRRGCDPDGVFINNWYERYIAPALTKNS